MKRQHGLRPGFSLCYFVLIMLYGCAGWAKITFDTPAIQCSTSIDSGGDNGFNNSPDGCRPYYANVSTIRRVAPGRWEYGLSLSNLSPGSKGIRVSTRKLVADGWKASWSPDGKRIVYGQGRGGRLRILELESGETTDLTAGGKDPAWSPDGQHIAFTREEAYNRYHTEEVWLVMASGGSVWRLAGGGYSNWSADGRTLYLQTRQKDTIDAIDVNDIAHGARLFYDGPQSWYPAVSPDGKQIVFGKAGSLVVVDRETAQTVLTWPTPGSRGLLPAWSPDGTRIAFGGFDNSALGLWVLNVETEEAVQVADGPYTMPAWSKDGTKLAFDLRTGSKREIWMVEVEAIGALKPSRPTIQRRYPPFK